jgi:multidrug efflux system membrane fusion protein
MTQQSGRRIATARLWLLAALIGMSASAGCSKQQAAAPAAAPTIPVMVATAESKTVPVQVRSIGHVDPYSTVSLKPLVSGELVGIHIQEGQDVKRGDLLFEIDRRPFEVALEQASAMQARDKAQADNARAEEARYAKLLGEGVVSKEQADQFHAAAATADAQVRADQAAIDQAKLNLDWCTITSPIDGRTGALMVYKGNLVKSNDVPVLLVINQINPIYVTFAVPEQVLSDVKKYRAQGTLQVQATIPGGGDKTETGTLSFVDNAVDKTTGTITMKGTFANESRRLWPGQFVDVVLTLTQRSSAIVVPSGAVQSGQNGQYVFVVRQDNTVEERKVTTGTTFAGGTVIEQGVQARETVVTDGQLRLITGSKIRLKTPAEAAASSPQGKTQ